MRKTAVIAFSVFFLALVYNLVYNRAGAETLAKSDFDTRLDVRKVSIVFYVDRDLLEKRAAENVQSASQAPDIYNTIIKMTEAGSRVFEKEFGIAFVIEGIKPWGFPAGRMEIDADQAIDDTARLAESEAADITIGIVKKPMFKCQKASKDEPVPLASGCAKGEKKVGVAGYAYVLGNAAVIELGREKGIFIHELGHIFGAEHTSEDSVMNDYRIGVRFDKKSREIIIKNRMRTFEKIPLP